MEYALHIWDSMRCVVDLKLVRDDLPQTPHTIFFIFVTFPGLTDWLLVTYRYKFTHSIQA